MMMARDEADALRESILDLRTRVDDVVSALEVGSKKSVNQRKEELEARIMEKPLQSAGIAFASGVMLGMLAGALMGRRQ
jgi:ElaB/YqjD/DUF883 family membrane-anchored ribosome-binding protein